MKTHSLIILFFVLSHFASAIKPTLTYQFVAPTLDKYVLPNFEYGSTMTFIGGSALNDVRIVWTITNGTLKAEGKTSNSTLTTFFPGNITVLWDDIASTGVLSAKVTWANPNDSTLYNIKMTGATSVQYPILSLKNATTKLDCPADLFPLGSSQKQTVTVFPETEYPHIMEYSPSIGQYRKKAEKYQWTLPNGWKTVQNQTGTFITDKNSIDVIPDPLNGNEIKVRASNAYSSSFSNYATATFNRKITFTSYPPSIGFGDIREFTFGVSKVNVPGMQYQWMVPNGWQINGGSSSLLTSSESVKVKALQYQGDAEVKARLKYNGVYSDWTVCPYKGITTPSVKCNQNETYVFEPLTFYIDPSQASNAIITWNCSNGEVISGQGTNQATVAPILEGSLTVYAKITPPGYTAPSTFQTNVAVKPDRITLEGQTTLCSESGTFAIKNAPQNATIQWKLSNGNFGLSKTSGNSVQVYPFQYNADAVLSASITCYNRTIEKKVTINSCALQLLGPGRIACAATYRVNYLLHQSTISWEYPSGIVSEIQRADSIRISATGKSRTFQLKAVIKRNGSIVNTAWENIEYFLFEGMEYTYPVSIKKYDSYNKRFYYIICAQYLPLDYPDEYLQYYWFAQPVLSKQNPFLMLTPKVEPCLKDGSGHLGIGPLLPVTPAKPMQVKTDTAAIFIQPDESSIVILRGTSVPQTRDEIPRFTGYNVIDGKTGKVVSPPDLSDLLQIPNDIRYAIVTMPEEECETTVTCRAYPECGKSVSLNFPVNNYWIPVYDIAPNPVNKMLTLNRVNDIKSNSTPKPEPLSIVLYNDYGILRTIYGDTSSASLQMNTSDIPDGNYYANIIQNGQVVNRQVVIIKH